MEHSDELRDLMVRLYEASTTGDLSFVDRYVSRQEGAAFIGTNPGRMVGGLRGVP